MGVNPHVLYSCLYADLSDQIPSFALQNLKNGVMDWPEITFKEKAASALRSSLFKKIESGMTAATKKAALSKFLQVDSACKDWVKPSCDRYGDDFLLGEFKSSLYSFWNVKKAGFSTLVPLAESAYDFFHEGGVGPGVSVGSQGNDFYSKLFSSPLTATSQHLIFLYQRYIRAFPEWCNAESIRTLTYGSPTIVRGNRLDFVPKNDDISRSICVEPTLNMFAQLGFMKILCSRLVQSFGIDLTYQQFKNRELARIGSRDGSFVTIDLSSASDSISLNMLKEYLPPDFLRLLVQLRCKETRLPDGTWHSTNMVSTMGNGTTFPLQTIIFACVVMSAFRMSGLAPIYPFGNSLGNFGVNGDDIIVPSELAPKVLRLLSLLGFSVNKDKTFVEGPFRESCGGDFFNGRNLRGVFIKRLSEPQDFYAVINQLNQFSTRTGILLPSVVQFLLSKCRFLPVPRWENDDAGIKLPFSCIRKQLKVSSSLHGTILYRAWCPKQPPALRIMDSAVFVPRSYKPRMFNPSGLHIAFLQRTVNGHMIPCLPKKVRYGQKSRLSPSWDFVPDEEDKTIQLLKGWFDWSRWETVAYINIFS